MAHRLTTLLLLLVCCATFTAAQIIAPARVRVSSGVVAGLMRSKVSPDYPPLARQARIQGTVLLKTIISKTGDVTDIQLISGHPMLAPAAIQAVKQWKYAPYLLNGEPVEVETQVQVNFSLEKPPADGVAGDAPSSGAAGSVAGGVPGGVTGGVIGSILSSMPPDPNHPVPQRVRVSSGVAQGLLLSKVQPEYPQEAKDQRIQGEVLLQVRIDKEGNVANIQLISGHPLLAPPAIDAVKQWKYKPYLLNGAAVEVETQVKVNYTLNP